MAQALKKVYVVTGFDLGWDCVVGVFDADTVTYEELEKEYPEGDYYVNERDVEINARM